LATTILPEFYHSMLTFASPLYDFLMCHFHHHCVLFDFMFVMFPAWIIFLVVPPEGTLSVKFGIYVHQITILRGGIR
jgi:hypothetical protein